MTEIIDVDSTAVEWFVLLQECEDEAVWERHLLWLQAAPEHAAAYARVEACWIDVEQLDASHADDDAQPEHRLAADNDTDGPQTWYSRPQPSARRARWWLPVGAAVAATVVGVVVLPRVLAPADPSVVATYSDAGPGVRRFVLSDGSNLILSPKTKVVVAMAVKERHASVLGGEAVFDVVHQTRRPFTVSAGDRDISVLGTEFGVVSRGGMFSVAVRRGVVSVSSHDADDAAVRLPAGTALTHLAGSGRDTISKIDVDQQFGWTQGRLVYRDSPIDALAADLSRYTGQKVSVAPAVSALRISGTIKLDDRGGVDRQVEELFALRIERTPDGNRLSNLK